MMEVASDVQYQVPKQPRLAIGAVLRSEVSTLHLVYMLCRCEKPPFRTKRERMRHPIPTSSTSAYLSVRTTTDWVGIQPKYDRNR